MKKLICTIIIVTVALVALAGIWCPEFLAKVLQWFDWAKNWLLTLLVFVLAAFLLCICCPIQSTKEKQKCDCNEEGADPEKLEPPYPDSYKGEPITKFSYDSHLILMRLKKRLQHVNSEKQYIVAKDYTVSFGLEGKENRYSITVPKGMLTDLASVPRMLRFIAGRVGPHLEACVVHDYLYFAWQKECNTDKDDDPADAKRLFADRLMLKAMYTAGMGCRARLIYWAVRCFGCCIFYSKKPEPLVLSKEHFPECCFSKNGNRTVSKSQ